MPVGETASSYAMDGLARLGAASVTIMTIALMANNHFYVSGSFSWDGTGKESVHAVLGVLSLVFLQTNAVLSSRVDGSNKLAYAGLMTLALVLMIVSLVAAQDLKSDTSGSGYNNMQVNELIGTRPGVHSVHAWMGVFVALLFCVQYIISMCVAFELGPHASLRSPAKFLGMFVLMSSLAQVAVGAENGVFQAGSIACDTSTPALFNTCKLFCGIALTSTFVMGAAFYTLLPHTNKNQITQSTHPE